MNIGFRNGLKFGSIIWVLAFSYATIIMILIGVDFEDSDNPFGIHHEKYLLFEMIIIPSLIIFSLYMLNKHFRSTGYNDKELVTFGITIMVIQFVLDFLIIVITLGNGLEYFYALVTLSYFSIPFFVYYVGKKVE